MFLGIFVNSRYERFSESKKIRWRQSWPTHHYKLGFIAAIIGAVFSPILFGIGIGLIVTDLRDLKADLPAMLRKSKG